MKKINYATIDQARTVVQQWEGKPDSVRPIGQSASAVFQFETISGQLQILRITDANFRPRKAVEAELQFIAHLDRCGCSVAIAIPSIREEWTWEFSIAESPFVAVSFRYAPGEVIRSGHPHWDQSFFKAWGKGLGEINAAARSYRPPAGTAHLWVWNREMLFDKAYELIPTSDPTSRAILRSTVEECLAQAATNENYGVIHADFGPQNFHYNINQQRITAFDFGNSCYHFYLSDLAIALTTIAREPNREAIKAALLEGYRLASPLPDHYEAELDKYMRLRHLYVYLDRLFMFGWQPTVEQQQVLEQLKQRVHRRKGGWWA